LTLESAPSALVAEQLTADPLKIFELGVKRMQSRFTMPATKGATQSPFRSADGSLSLLFVEAKGNARSSTFSQGLIRQARAAAAACDPATSYRVGYTGSVAFAADISAKMRSDMIVQAFNSLVAVLLIFWLGFRRIYPLICISLTLALAIVATLACGQVLFHGLNLITVSFAAILIGLGVDYGIVIYAWLAAARQSGRSAETIARDVVRFTVPTILLGASATIAAFAALALSHSPAFRQFSVVHCIGIAFCAGLMLIFFLFLQMRRLPPVRSQSERTASSEGIAQNARGIALCAVLLCLVAVATLTLGKTPAVRFDTNPDSLDFRHLAAKDTLNRVSQKMNRSKQSVQVLVSGRNWLEATRRARELDAKLETGRAAGRIASFDSAARFLPPTDGRDRIESEMRQIDFRAVKKIFTQALADQHLNVAAFATTSAWLDKMGNDGLATDPIQAELTQSFAAMPSLSPFLRRFLHVEPTKWTLATYVYSTDSLRDIAAVDQLERALGEDHQTVRVTGWDLLMTVMLPHLKEDFQRISLVVFAGITMMLIAYYRRPVLVMLALTPLLMSILWLLAVMKALGMTFNLANFFVIPILLGTGIDYSIYVMNAWRQEEGDVARGTRKVGKAVVMAAAATTVGFGSMMISDHPGMRSFGVLVSMGIFFCALNALVVLPALLQTWKIRSR
jgi:predicted RND superfamily exporter protein